MKIRGYNEISEFILDATIGRGFFIEDRLNEIYNLLKAREDK
jgi:hypothetical protein